MLGVGTEEVTTMAVKTTPTKAAPTDLLMTADLIVWDEHWPECADTLRLSLAELAGMETIDIDPISGALTLTFRPAELLLKKLVAVIQEAGFSVAVDAIRTQ
jgi:copper chaperone CopZ